MKRFLAASLAFLVLFLNASASVTGWAACSSAVDDATVSGAQWLSEALGSLSATSVQTSDASYAVQEDSLIMGANSHYLKCTGFDLTTAGLPASVASIDGFEVELTEVRVSGFNVSQTVVKFVKAGAVTGTDFGNVTNWPTTEGPVVYGNSTQLGGVSWARSDVVNSNQFGLVLEVFNNQSVQTSDAAAFKVNLVRIRAYYTAAATATHKSLGSTGAGIRAGLRAFGAALAA